MKILIVNDDSVSAPGIAVLAEAARSFGEVTVVAPARECSAMSQKLTLRELISLEEVADFPAPVRRAWRIGGTPVDCVKVAVEYLLEEKPDLVLSGINDGFNAGQDISHSGTAGAAFEAQRFGIPAIALSVARFKYLDAMEPWLLPLLRELTQKRPASGCVWNVNFPAVREDVLCRVSSGTERSAPCPCIRRNMCRCELRTEKPGWNAGAFPCPMTASPPVPMPLPSGRGISPSDRSEASAVSGRRKHERLSESGGQL